jgi:hypothetical protein
MMASSGVSDKQAQLDGAKATLLAIPPPEAPDTSQSTLVAEKDARLTVLGTALGNRIAWDRVLREVSLVLPDDVWLETMSTNGPDPAAAATRRHRARPWLRPAAHFRSPGTRTRTTALPVLLARLSVIPHRGRQAWLQHRREAGSGRSSVFDQRGLRRRR